MNFHIISLLRVYYQSIKMSPKMLGIFFKAYFKAAVESTFLALLH